jgi:hypothetical protein
LQPGELDEGGRLGPAILRAVDIAERGLEPWVRDGSGGDPFSGLWTSRSDAWNPGFRDGAQRV